MAQMLGKIAADRSASESPRNRVCQWRNLVSGYPPVDWRGGCIGFFGAIGDDLGMNSEEKPPQRDVVRELVQKVEREINKIDVDGGLMDQLAERPFMRQTWKETLYLLSTIPAGIAALLIWVTGISLAIPLVITVVGIPLVFAILWAFRGFVNLERRRVTILGDGPIEADYERVEGNFVERGLGVLKDAQTWKDIGWLIVLSLAGFPVAVLSLSVWLIAFGWIIYPLWGWALPGDATPIGWLVGDNMSFFESFLMIPLGFVLVVIATWLCAAVALGLATISRLLLATTQERALRGRVTELERTREQSLSQQSTEMSRIERDLHDGAQARLVALAMDLGMAEQKIEDDPAAARKLVGEARDEAQRTLQELRDLVRGIGPQILRDRGLEAALVPLAARSAIKVEVGIDLPERPDERVESAAYFVCSEALANAIKHSSATQININAWRSDDWFYLRISDNGVGGADDANGEGLRGLRARVEAVDGKLVVDSPAEGPTIIDAWLPFRLKS